MRIFTLSCLLFSIIHCSTAQIIADFETPGSTPSLSQQNSSGVADVRVNPDAVGNSSSKVAYYAKDAANWQAIYFDFSSDKNVGSNDRLSFKLRTSVKGRVFVKIVKGTTLLEGWAPDYNTQPDANKWTECIMDISKIKGAVFNRIEINAGVDNLNSADVYIDDIKLFNSAAANGEPLLELTTSSTKISKGESVHFDASESYDADGTIVSYLWNFGDSNNGSGSVIDHVYENEGVYHASLTITDNDGKWARRELMVSVFPVAGKVTQLTITTPELLTNKKIEGEFALREKYTNVFNPDEVTVDAVITMPDASTKSIPCFFFEKATYTPDNWTKQDSTGVWMVRFTSSQSGLHTLTLKRKDVNGTSVTEEQSFNVEQSDEKGVVQQDVNKQYYRHASGEPFYPLGINVAWNTTSNYTSIINNLSAGRANLVRYWQVPFDRQGLEWKNGSGFYKGLGVYSQEAAAEQDSMLNLCEAKNMYMQITLFQHGMFSETVNSNWNENPYSSVNGGMLTSAEQYFYNADAKARTKKLLRYIVARWGYSVHIFAWELFNEVQFTGNFPNQTASWSPAVNAWHDEMGKYIKSIDAFHHIVTTSADDARLPALDKSDGVDVVQYHMYSDKLLSEQISQDRKFISTVSSVINGEYGTQKDANVPFDDQRLSIWTGIMTQVPHLMWTWENYGDSKWSDLFKYPATYVSDEDFASNGSISDFSFTAKNGKASLTSIGFKNAKNYYALIYDPAAGENLASGVLDLGSVSASNAGMYEVSYYDVLTGVIKKNREALYPTRTSFNLPVFSKAIAVKIKFESDITKPIAVAGLDKTVLTSKELILSGDASYNPSPSSQLSYAWTMLSKPVGSASSLSDASNVSSKFTPDKIGVYKISLVVSNSAGSSLADTVVVTADNITATNEQLNSKFLVYPNPASDHIYIESPVVDNETFVELSDMVGRMIFSQRIGADSFSEGKISIYLKDNISGSGIYLLRLRTNTFSGVRRIRMIEK